jgi:transposase-like protein
VWRLAARKSAAQRPCWTRSFRRGASAPLGETSYQILDARYEKIRHGGSAVSCAGPAAIGVTPQGGRSIPGVSVSLFEAEVHWRELLASLQDHGLHGMRPLAYHNRADNDKRITFFVDDPRAGR